MPDERANTMNKAGIDGIEKQSNLTRSQFLFWLGQQRYADAPLYNIPFAFHLTGGLDIDRFRRAFAAEVAANDALQTVIDVTHAVPQQRALRGTALEALVRRAAELPIADFSGDDHPEDSARHWFKRHARKCLRLDEPMWDSALLVTGSKSFIWFLNQHHIITDALSSMRILNRVMLAYNNPQRPLDKQGSFAAFALSERESRLASNPEPAGREAPDRSAMELDQPIFYGRYPAAASPASELQAIELRDADLDSLRRIAADTGMLSKDLGQFCVYTTLLASFVARTTNARHFTIGVPLQNRKDPVARETPGLFVDVVPLVVEIREDDTFASLLRRIQADSIQMLRHAGSSASTAGAEDTPNVVINLFNTPLPPIQYPDVRTEWIHPGASDADHALRLHVHQYDGGGELNIQLEFNKVAFGTAERQLALQHFQLLISAFVRRPDQQILQVDLLTAAERELYIDTFNDTARPFADTNALELFERQAEENTDSVAVNEGDRTHSYGELNARATALAVILARRGVAAGTLVPILLGRCTEAVVAILAVLKTGAAYLPLNPQEPPLRLSAILADALGSSFANVGPLVTRADIAIEGLPVDRLNIDLDSLDATEAALIVQRRSHDPVYVIYTSGSTGTPKGVVVEDNALANYLQWARDQYADGPIDFALHSSPAVDLTVTSIYLPLITGGRVEVFGEDGGTGEIPIAEVFAADNVDAVKLTPAHLSIVRSLPGKATRIRTLILGGEDLKSATVRGVLDKFPAETRLFNEYGPTEATVGCMIHAFDATTDQWTSVPVGRPIANMQIYLTNEAGQPVPAGVVGEIRIGGAGVARGYLSQTAETASRFVRDPFRSGANLYRTGDLGRWSGDGRLEFLGREDRQVKIRGVRVEAAEVQAAIQGHPEVDDCVVIINNRAERRLVEYCADCGIPSNHPDVQFDSEGVCSLCIAYDKFRDQAQRYFRTPAEFEALVEQIKSRRKGKYDCLALFSGGKDSTFMLYKLVELGLKPLAFTLDNGHISEGAKANITRAVQDLGVDHTYGSTPHMPEIFADSLARYSNVCNGCFKTIYTLSVNLARENDVDTIVTGLSRGQIFETRLHDLFRHRIFDSASIEKQIIEARKIYHRMQDAVANVLDVSIFSGDEVFSKTRFVDFYRYWDVPLDEVYAFLRDRAPWARPKDTGRSTNCLINDAGIYVHKQERGYHNYALPYSWDVRLGHKTRAEALDELNDDIDVDRVRDILRQVGYSERQATGLDDERELLAYFVGGPLSEAQLRDYLNARLPTEMIPARIVRLDKFPLNASGKVAEDRLPTGRPGARTADYTAPRTDLEKQLAAIWEQILGIERVGARDNFFDIGGHSLPAIQVISRISESFGIDLPIRAFFKAPTIANVAKIVEDLLIEQIEQLSDVEVEQHLGSIRNG